MAVEIKQECSWPGVVGVESCTGTVSHGIGPAAFVLTCYPQTAVPNAFGTLVIGDGFRRVVLRDCKVENLTGSADSSGQAYTLTILDRRWRWKTGVISGRYNQLDPRGKLIPWTIRSPYELAELCLKAMGEKNYRIDLPAGLTRAAGQNLNRFLALGENFPQSLANPPTVWDVIPPAVALARLADQYGCRVVWQPVADRVLVTPLGKGRAQLPNEPCESIAPAITQPAVPRAVGVAGAPVRIQMRLLLEAVGQEWDESWVPIDELSYAPQSLGKVQISTVTWDSPAANDPGSVKVYITYRPQWHPPVGDPIRATYEIGGVSSAEDKFAQIVNAIGNNPDISKLIIANYDGDVLTLEGREAGFPFQVKAETSAALPDTLTAALVQAPERSAGTWEACPPPSFAGVRATNRLSYDQALQLARGTVFKNYRVRCVDIADGVTPRIVVPWFGIVKRRQSLVLQPVKVDMVEPEPRKRGGVQANPDVPQAVRNIAGGVLPDFFNGYSRNKPACVYGSVRKKDLGSVLWEGVYNTDAEDQVYVQFSINAVEQLVQFSDYVYMDWPVANTLNQIRTPALTLETAVLVTDEETNQLARWQETMPLPGGVAPPEWEIHDDVQMSVIAGYGPKNKPGPFAFAFSDLVDAKPRARYYLHGMAKKYELKGGESRQYIGIKLIDLDGAVQQISWSIGAGGATTTVSTNGEHSEVIPSYPTRRRSENDPPNKAAARANIMEDWLRGAIPNPPGKL